MPNSNVEIIVGARNEANEGVNSVIETFRHLGEAVKAVTIGNLLAGGIEGVLEQVKELVGEIFKTGHENEAVVHALGAALQGVGVDAASALPDLREFAAELGKFTTYSGNAVISLMTLGTNLTGFTGEALKSATVAALGLAQKFGIDAESAMRLLGKAANGNTETLARYGIVLDGNLDAQGKFNQLLGIGAHAFDQVNAAANTTSGKLTILGHDFEELLGSIFNVGDAIAKGLFGDGPGIIDLATGIVESITEELNALATTVVPIAKKIGAALSDAFEWWSEHVLPASAAEIEFWASVAVATWQMVEQAVGALANGIAAALNFIGLDFKSFTEVMDFFRDGLQAAFLMGEFVVKHWREFIELDMLAGTLAIVTFANQVQYFFVEVIPAVIKWFAENWSDIFTDVFNFTTTVFQNLGSNIVSFFSQLPNLISGSVSFAQIWTPLTDGFESHLRALPEIAARHKGDLETALGEMVSSLQGSLGEDFDKFMEEGLKRTGNAGQRVKDFFKNLIPSDAFKLPPITAGNVNTAGAKQTAGELAKENALPKLVESDELQGIAQAFQSSYRDNPVVAAVTDLGGKADETNSKLDSTNDKLDKLPAAIFDAFSGGDDSQPLFSPGV